MRNVSDKGWREDQNTLSVFNNPYYIFFLNRAVYEIMVINIIEADRPQMRI